MKKRIVSLLLCLVTALSLLPTTALALSRRYITSVSLEVSVPEDGAAPAYAAAPTGLEDRYQVSPSTGGGYANVYTDTTAGATVPVLPNNPAPRLIQGVACHNGYFYVTADDGDADKDEPDTIWRGKIVPDAETVEMTVDRKLDDVTRQGEIEGLTFDREKNRMLVLYNHGARIILGMPTGFYEGYDHEIHEVFSYDIK